MSVDFRDPTSGFRHTDVIRFINNEILMNGGSSDFYVAFRSRPWNEVEDQLLAIINDPEVPYPIKRASAWSALALSVCVLNRQHEQHVHQIQQLQGQVEEREAATWALASELQRLREEHHRTSVQLRGAWSTLQQVMDEREVLRGRLSRAQVNILPQVYVPVGKAEQLGATAWPMVVQEQGKVVAVGTQGTQHLGAQGMRHFEPQRAASRAVVYVPEVPNPWAWARARAMHTSLPMSAPRSFPLHSLYPMGVSFPTPLPPSVVREAKRATETTAIAVAATATTADTVTTDAAVTTTAAITTAAAITTTTAAVPQMLPLGIWPPVRYAAVRTQEKAPLCDQSYCGQEQYPDTLHCASGLGNNRSDSQEEGLVCPQWVSCPKDIKSLNQKDLERTQGIAPLEENSSQKECPAVPVEKIPLGNSESHSQESPKRPQQIILMPGSKSLIVQKSPKDQQPQGQKDKQPKGKKASNSQDQEKLIPGDSPGNWDCPWCKTMNFSWRKSCYGCKKVYMVFRSRSVDPGETQ